MERARESADRRGTPWVGPGSAAMTTKCCQAFTSAHVHGQFHHSMTLNRRPPSTGTTDAHTLYSCSLCEIRHAVPPIPLCLPLLIPPGRLPSSVLAPRRG